MLKKGVRLAFCGWLLAVCMCSMCWSAAPAAEPKACIASDTSQTRSVIDMAGRKVVVPRKVFRIATVGPGPVLNSYLFALGEGKKIANGLPYFAQTKRWWVQTMLAPHLANQPVLQGPSREVNMEVLLKLNPDVVITMGPWNARAFENAGIPVVFLEWRNASDIKANMRILGCVLDRMSRSNEYLHYFDTTINRVRRVWNVIPGKSRPKVLYFDPDTLTTPLAIADWWIEEAGGRSVTAGISRSENIRYSHEQVLLWNPDIMIVPAQERINAVYRDKRLSKTRAVLNKRIYAIPMGAHTWGHRTVEQPLTVLWAAKIFYPDRFKQVSMEDEVRTFYQRFFEYDLSDKDIRRILTGVAE
ncbi:MAG: corrinoid ABC transporter substrate-binding protein [Syntrophorhabdus sp. PtaU1.Bin050]|nr:MAG: corrinoid ABC transporter substrate-binding protein [Syntrophorhabdus sp. PtaU1.Bin050]